MDLLLLGKTPIHPDAPAGSDIRYDPDFEALQAEIDKLSSPSATDGVDWKKVNDNAVRILSEKSKDLTVASYLAVSQVHVNRIDGFALGVTVLCDLLRHYWDDLFPPKKRMRGRAGAIQFWLEKSEAALGGIQEAADMETLDRIRQTLMDMDGLLQAHLPDPPLLHAINRHIQTMIEKAEKTVSPATPLRVTPVGPDPPAQEKNLAAGLQADMPPERKPPAASPAAEPAIQKDAGETASEQDAATTANAGFQQIRSAGLSLFDKDFSNPDAYRYRRIASWAKVSALPPATGGKTQIPPPSAQEINALESAKTDSNWAVLLSTAEQKLSRFIFWLDLCRFSAEALARLGEDCQPAQKAICDETAFFMMRIPGLDGLAFSDGMPFADGETRQWLKQIALGGISDQTAQMPLAAAESSDGQSDAMNEMLEKAKSLARRKKVMEAVALIQLQLRQSVSAKTALSWRMALCQILLGSTFKHVASPHLEQVIADIDNYHLEKWDPDVALRGLVLAWTGFQAMADDRYGERADALLNRISRLDPAEALRLSR